MRQSARRVPVSDVMTSHVHTALASQQLQDIWKILVEERCHHVPIVEDDRPIGMVSSRDLVRVARKHGAQKISAGLYGGETAHEIMSTNLETIHLTDSVEAAIDRIGHGDIHALIVIDDEGDLAGIVTNHDLLDYLIR
jgi:CBS domain-containing protein